MTMSKKLITVLLTLLTLTALIASGTVFSPIKITEITGIREVYAQTPDDIQDETLPESTAIQEESEETQQPAPTIPLTTPETRLEAEVLEVVSEEEQIIFGTKQTIQRLKIRITTGDDEGKIVETENSGIAAASTPTFKAGDLVVVSRIQQPDSTVDYFVIDYVRRTAMFGLFALFVLVAVIVAGRHGIASLLGMGYSFFIIFKFLLPQISAGQDPIMSALISGMMIIPVTFYASHGFNKKTHSAIAGTTIALVITAILSHYAIEWGKLTGFASEDAAFLEVMTEGSLNIKGLLLAGIIVGLLGVLDDITVSQSAIVYKLRETSPGISKIELYKKSMDVGRDHIGSMVNTLILVYTGAALPFLLLITAHDSPILTTINFEMIAEEIIRTLTASIGLIIAVPITTFIAVQYK